MVLSKGRNPALWHTLCRRGVRLATIRRKMQLLSHFDRAAETAESCKIVQIPA